MANKRTKAGRLEVFKKNVETFLEVCGAVRVDNRMYDWTLYTRAGNLGVTIQGSTIFTRFDDSAAGRQATLCGHTGKWNFHYTDETLDQLFATFTEQIETLLDYQPTEEHVKTAARLRAEYKARWAPLSSVEPVAAN